MATQHSTSDQNGFSIIEALIIIVVIGAIGFIGWHFMSSHNNGQQGGKATRSTGWTFDGAEWKANGKAPACPNPLNMTPPVDLEQVTGILYPGQYRGGNYKTHGGFKLADGTNDTVTVKAPMDGVLYKGSRYIEQGETQYLLFIVNPCGIMYRFDHLATLSPTFQKIVDDTFPPAQEDNSATTNFSKTYEVKTGDTIATSVGFKKTGNTTFDFGVYDLRTPNEISKNSGWASTHANEKEFAYVGTCWFDDFSSEHAAHIKSLPAVDSLSGSISDYCKTAAGTTLTNTVGNPSSSSTVQSTQSSATAGGGSGTGSGNGTGGGTGHH